MGGDGEQSVERWDSARSFDHNERGCSSSTWAAPPNRAATLESQMIHPIQELPGQTLRPRYRRRGPGHKKTNAIYNFNFTRCGVISKCPHPYIFCFHFIS